jgi:hypothetical protein
MSSLDMLKPLQTPLLLRDVSSLGVCAAGAPVCGRGSRSLRFCRCPERAGQRRCLPAAVHPPPLQAGRQCALAPAAHARRVRPPHWGRRDAPAVGRAADSLPGPARARWGAQSLWDAGRLQYHATQFVKFFDAFFQLLDGRPWFWTLRQLPRIAVGVLRCLSRYFCILFAAERAFRRA